MQEVMRQIIADVAKDTAAVSSDGGVPIPENQEMSKLPERSCKSHKERGGHDKSVSIHGKIMMNAVEQEMQCDADPVVRKITKIFVSNSFL